MSILNELLITLFIIWPSYVANATPVIVGKAFKRRTPIDLGKNFIDGRRIFGDGKTYEGFTCGLIAGFVIGEMTYLLVPDWIRPYLPTPFAVFMMCLGALTGDLIGAFIKRRLGLPRGAPVPLLDQLDFLLMALFTLWLIEPWLLTPLRVILAIAITPPIHLLTNAIAYLLRLKKEPW